MYDTATLLPLVPFIMTGLPYGVSSIPPDRHPNTDIPGSIPR